MDLTTEQQEMRGGKLESGVAKAMEILLAYGQCYDARRLIPMTFEIEQ
jgi:predicted aconitase